ncbi:MAG: DUF4159 domain-containing protein [Acidobacteriota bacterium]
MTRPKGSVILLVAVFAVATAVVAAVPSLLSSPVVTAGAASSRVEPPSTPDVEYPVYEYNGNFTFARIKFEPTRWGFGEYTWGLDLKWNHDYPQAEQNLMRILDEVTGIVPRMEGGNLIELTDPRLFEHPWAYMCEPGFWNPTEEELENLRSYLLKGGFLVIDDFFNMRGDFFQWRNFARQMKRLFPDYSLVEMTGDEPIFHSFFDLEDINFGDPRLPQLQEGIFAIYEDNDPEKRIMLIANYNMDIGDFWEWSDTSFYPIPLTQKGFRLGVNYVTYGLTH